MTTETLVADKLPSPSRDQYGQLLPGHTANPAGRQPGDLMLTPILRRLLNVPQPINGRIRAEKTVETLIDACESGQPWAQAEVWSRIDGKVKDTLELQGSLTLTAEEVRRIEVSVNGQLAAIYQRLHLDTPVDTTFQEIPPPSTTQPVNAAQIELPSETQPTTQPDTTTNNVQARAREGAPPRGLTRDQRLDWWAGIERQAAEAQP